MVNSTAIVGALNEAGYRLTSPRRAVAELIGSRRGHFTADELLTRLAEGGINAMAESDGNEDEDDSETKGEEKSVTRRGATKPRTRSRATKARN